MRTIKAIYNFLSERLTILFFLFLVIFTFDRHHRYEATTNPNFGPFESDVAEYYSYLPTFFYGSPEQIKMLCENNKRTIGMAILYSPAFLVGDLIARFKGEKTNGYSEPYQWSVRWGSIIYCILGLWFTRKVLLLFFNEIVTLITLACTFFGTNLFYYTYSNGEFAHSYLFFLFSLFLLFTINLILKNKRSSIIWMGLILGLIILIRPTSGLIVLFPLLYKINCINDFKDRITILFIKNKMHFFIGLVLFLTPLIIQMFIWKVYYDQFIYYSYKDEQFFFNDPQIINFLFSFQKGWLIYTPIMIFSLIGIILLKKHFKDMFMFEFFFTTLNIYVLSSWWDWGYGGSFGCRALIESYAILAIPFAIFINWSFSIFNSYKILKTAYKVSLLTILFLLIKLNLFQTWQYKYLIIHWSGMNKKAYKYVFLKERLTKEELRYLHDSLVVDVDVEKRKRGIRD